MLEMILGHYFFSQPSNTNVIVMGLLTVMLVFSD